MRLDEMDEPIEHHHVGSPRCLLSIELAYCGTEAEYEP